LGDAVEQGLPAGSGGRVFYLCGDDEFRKEEALRKLIDEHVDPATRDFNLDSVRGPEVNAEALVTLLGTPPMMAEVRVVVLREVQALASASRLADHLLRVAASPPPGLVLLLAATEPPQSKARLYQELRRMARVLEFRSPSEADLPGWLMEMAEASFGVRIDEAAARALAQGIGAHPGILAMEVEKLSSVVGRGETITAEVVERAGIRLPRQDRWGWFDLVGSTRFPEAHAGLALLTQQGESAVGLVAGLATHLLRLGVVRSGGARALEEVLPPRQSWLARRLAEQARHWSVEELEQAVEELLEIDAHLKSSAVDPEHFLESWLLGLRARAGRAA